jgi:hypothetical protein
VHNLQLIQNKVHNSADVSWGLVKVHCLKELKILHILFLKQMDFINLQYTLMYVSQRLKMGKNGTTPKGLFDVCQPRS